MGASVRVESEAFMDERFVTLARLAGLADADHARGKMLRLWRQCTDKQMHTLLLEHVISVLGANGPDALVKADLGEYVEGGIRIRGTSGRIEWLEKLRKNGKKGGKANAKQVLGKRQASEEKEKEREQEEDLESLPSPEALAAADELRDAIVQQQPKHRLAKGWTATARRKWAAELDAMHRRDNRDWGDVSDVIHWVFHGQRSDFPFVVQSPSALAEKWDRIDAAKRRPARPAPSHSGSNSGLQAVLEIARGEQ